MLGGLKPHATATPSGSVIVMFGSFWRNVRMRLKSDQQ